LPALLRDDEESSADESPDSFRDAGAAHAVFNEIRVGARQVAILLPAMANVFDFEALEDPQVGKS